MDETVKQNILKIRYMLKENAPNFYKYYAAYKKKKAKIKEIKNNDK